jgi:hypothetical protein
MKKGFLFIALAVFSTSLAAQEKKQETAIKRVIGMSDKPLANE